MWQALNGEIEVVWKISHTLVVLEIFSTSNLNLQIKIVI